MKPDLFGGLADNLVGLQVTLRDRCVCKCDIARITQGQWGNVPFCCERCGRERGRLSYATQDFLRRAIKLFGRPTSPLKIKQPNYIETSSQPPGAGAEMQSPAPTNADSTDLKEI